MTVFVVHFKLACVGDNVLMRHKNCRQLGIPDIIHGSCVVGHTGQLTDGLRGSWITKYDPLSALMSSDEPKHCEPKRKYSTAARSFAKMFTDFRNSFKSRSFTRSSAVNS